MHHEEKNRDVSQSFNLILMTFNVNGLLSCLRRLGYTDHRDLERFLENLIPGASVICLQEIKLRHQDLSQPLCRPRNWEAYYSLVQTSRCNKAKPASKRLVYQRGYSGVATFCRHPNGLPYDAREGISWVLNRLKQLYSPGTARLGSNMSDTFTKQTNLIKIILKKTYFYTWDQHEQKLVRKNINSQNLFNDLLALSSWADQLDEEGRFLFTHHGFFVLINIYAPALSTPELGNLSAQGLIYDPVRLTIKSVFHCLLHLGVLHIQTSCSSRCLPSTELEENFDVSPYCMPVIVAGDFNVRLNVKDGAEPLADYLAKKNILPFADQTKFMMDSCQLLDAFRFLNSSSDAVYTHWSQITGSRYTNNGSRIDLILVPRSFVQRDAVKAIFTLISCCCHMDLAGSDHCPVSATLCCDERNWLPSTPSRTPPVLCAKWLPQAVFYQPTLFETLGKTFLPKYYRCCYLVVTDRKTHMSQQFIDSKLLFLHIACPESEHHGGKNFSSVAYMFSKKNGLILSTKTLQVEGLLSDMDYKAASRVHCCPAFQISRYSSVHFRCNPFPTSIKTLINETETESKFSTPKRSISVKSPSLQHNARILRRLFMLTQTRWGVAFHLQSSYIETFCKNPYISLIEHPAFVTIFSSYTVPPLVFEWNLHHYAQRQGGLDSVSSCGTGKYLKNQSRIQFLSHQQSQEYFETSVYAPLCERHKIPCIKRVVKKPGKTQGKQFWSCVFPKSTKNDPHGRCKTFLWAT